MAACPHCPFPCNRCDQHRQGRNFCDFVPLWAWRQPLSSSILGGAEGLAADAGFFDDILFRGGCFRARPTTGGLPLALALQTRACGAKRGEAKCAMSSGSFRRKPQRPESSRAAPLGLRCGTCVCEGACGPCPARIIVRFRDGYDRHESAGGVGVRGNQKRTTQAQRSASTHLVGDGDA